jgi:hypothetical protein
VRRMLIMVVFVLTGVLVLAAGAAGRVATGEGGEPTRDLCPESDDFSGPCPVIHLSPHFEVKEKAILVQVRSSLEARVAVSALRHELGASSVERKTIPARTPTTFRLVIGNVMNGLLHRIPPRKTLPVQIIARVNHVTGNVSADRMTIHIPGRG